MSKRNITYGMIAAILASGYYVSAQEGDNAHFYQTNQTIKAQQLASTTLYAPWRDSYLKKATTSPSAHHGNTCVFCSEIAENNDEKHYILKRFKHHFVSLNLFPYAKGHQLIIPYEHVKEIHDLSPQARQELIEIITSSAAIARNVLHADGIQIGVNLGKAAGASVPDHLHIQVVPRWIHDTQFAERIGNGTSSNLLSIYKQLKPAFQRLSIPCMHVSEAIKKDNTITSDNQSCVFCAEIAADHDEKYFILKRFNHHVVVLNACPYAKGHLCIIPYEHVQKLDDLSPESRTELIEIITAGAQILENSVNTHSANICINIGSVAGLNKPDHLHVHLISRWTPDIGFIQMLGGTNVASCDLPTQYKQFKPAFDKITLAPDSK